MRRKGELIIVSNRLPITLTKLDSGEYYFQRSSGGLVTAISGMDREFKWVGWLGTEVNDENDRKKIRKELVKDKPKCYPVFIKQKVADQFYVRFNFIHHCLPIVY